MDTIIKPEGALHYASYLLCHLIATIMLCDGYHMATINSTLQMKKPVLKEIKWLAWNRRASKWPNQL